MPDQLIIAGVPFDSRLYCGTGKFASPEGMAAALAAARAGMVTIPIRRVDFDAPTAGLLGAIDPEQHRIVPNTSGAEDAEQAVALARLAREKGLPDWVKLEVTPDPRWMLPDPIGTLRAAEALVADGFTVLPYIGADPVLAKRLEDVGVATVMPLGSPIGSNQGLAARDTIAIIVEQASVPVIVDAGLGAPSHAAETMELGVDAIFVGTAIATARDPIAMARAFRLGVEAGRTAYTARTDPTGAPTLTGFLARDEGLQGVKS